VTTPAPCTATITHPPGGPTRQCAQPAGHYDHRNPLTAHTRDDMAWIDGGKGATPHRPTEA
jgi:hypothetical protein